MVPAFYPLVLVASLWFGLLWACARLPVRRGTRWVNLGFGVATVLILFLPVGGLRLWSWAFSLWPNPSLPLLGMVCVGLWQRLSGLAVFKPADWRATWIFGAVAGSALYLHPMLIGSLDLYYWGWERESAVWCLAALSVAYFACGNRHGILLLAGLIAHALGALESANCWDYVIDPFYWVISVVVVATRVVSWWLACWHSRRSRDRLVPLVSEAADIPKPAS